MVKPKILERLLPIILIVDHSYAPAAIPQQITGRS